MITGNGSYSNTDAGNHVVVGNYSSISRECYFHPLNDNHLCKINKKCVFTTNWNQPSNDGAKYIIGNDVWVGTGVKFLPGASVSDGAIVGAWTVVTKNVPPFAVVVGNPMRIVRYRFTQWQIKKLQEIRWWDWEDRIIQERKEDMYDIDVFLSKYG